MHQNVILLLPFVSVFFISFFLLVVYSQNTKQQRHVYRVLQNTGYRKIEKVDRFQTLSEKLSHLTISDNIVYIYSAIIGAIFYALYKAFLCGSFPPVLESLIKLIPFALFILIPFFYKKWVNNKRTEEILTTLPFIIDLLVICLEAGLSFTASISKIIQEMQNKSKFLAKKFQITVYELNAGIDKRTAFKNLVKRCYNHPDLKTFVSAIIQSESLGFSIVQTLRVQAKEIRAKKRQMVRTRISRMPVKLLFPLIFCIFPITCILIVGPGFIQILKALR